MMRKGMFYLAALFCCLWTAPAAWAGGTLTTALVERFLTDFPGYVEQVQRFENVSVKGPADYASYQFTAHQVIRYLEDLGWTPDGFADTTSAVLQAYAAIKVQEAVDSSEESMAAGRQQMEAALRDPNLTPEMKAALRQSMQTMAQAQQSQDAMGAEVPPENLAVVAPYAGRIEQMLEAISASQ